MHVSHQTTNYPQTTKLVLTQTHIKQKIHKHQTQNFRRISPSVLPLLKKHIRPGQVGIMDHSVDLLIPDFKKKYKKGMDISNKKKLYKCITANTSAIWQHAAHTADQLTSFS